MSEQDARSFAALPCPFLAQLECLRGCSADSPPFWALAVTSSHLRWSREIDARLAKPCWQ